MRFLQGIKWVFLVGGFAVLLFVAAICAHPFYLAPLVQAVGSRVGVEIGSARTEGFARLLLEDVSYEGPTGTRVTAGAAVLPMPFPYAAAYFSGKPLQSSELEVLIRGVDFEAGPAGKKPDTGGNPPMPRDLASQLSLAQEQVASFVPPLEVRDARLAISKLKVNELALRLEAGQLEASGTAATLNYESPFSLSLDLGTERLKAKAVLANYPLDLSADLVLGATDSDSGLPLEINGTLLQGQLDASVKFEPRRWRLAEGSLKLDGAGGTFPFGEDGELRIAQSTLTIAGSDLDWRYTVQAEGEAQLERERQPVRVESEGSINPESLEVVSLSLESPVAVVSLREPVALDIQPLGLTRPAFLDARLNLAALGVMESGNLIFEGAARPSFADAAIAFQGSLVADSFTGLPPFNASIDGLVEKGRVDLNAITLETGGEQIAKGEGGYDWARGRLLTSSLEGRLPAELADLVVPGWPVSEAIRFEIAAEGPVQGIEHSGKLEIADVDLPPLRPLQLFGTWEGEGLADLTARVEARLTDLKLEASLEAPALTRGREFRVNSLSLVKTKRSEESPQEAAEEGLLSLTRPTTLKFERGMETVAATLAELRLEFPGSEGSLSADIGFRKDAFLDIKASVSAVEVGLFNSLFRKPLIPDVRFESIEANLAVADPEAPVLGKLVFDASGTAPNGVPLFLNADLRLEREGVTFNRLNAQTAEIPLLKVAGGVPLRIEPFVENPQARFPPLRLTEGPWNLDYEIDLNELPRALSGATAVRVSNLRCEGRVEGEASRPATELELELDALELPHSDGGAGSAPGLKVRNLAISLKAEEERIRVFPFRFSLAGGERTASIDIEMEEFPWGSLPAIASQPERAVTLLESLQGSLDIKELPMQVLAYLAPGVFDRSGFLNVDVDFEAGGQLEGLALIRNASLQPLPAGGTLRRINTDILMEGRRIELESFTARLSGRELEMSGFADFQPWPEVPMELNIRGKTMDLVRSEGMIIRSDLDLKAATPGPIEAVTLSGELALKDSLLLQDLRDFTQPGTAGVARSPPFFSVDAKPFADWTLDVKITGDEFMRIRSPIVQSKLSADFRLAQTLGSPLLTGSASAEGGSFTFPFGRLFIEQAEARITEAQPDQIQINMRADGNTAGYAITLRGSGTVSDPEVRFSSIPPANSEDLLVLLTAGLTPGGSGEFASRAGRLALFFGQDLLNPLFGGGGESKLTIRNEGSITQGGRATQSAAYQISDDFVVIGEYDEFGDANVDLKWIFYER